MKCSGIDPEIAVQKDRNGKRRALSYLDDRNILGVDDGDRQLRQPDLERDRSQVARSPSTQNDDIFDRWSRGRSAF